MVGPQTCYNNFFAGKNKLAKGAPTKNNSTFIPIPVVSYVFSPMLAYASALT